MQVSASAALALQRDWHWLKKPLHDDCADASEASEKKTKAKAQEIAIFTGCPPWWFSMNGHTAGSHDQPWRGA